MNIFFEEEQQVSEEILTWMLQAAEYCLKMEGVDIHRSQISVTFVDLDEIRELNSTYRGVDSVTDVLSFPQFEDMQVLPEEGELCLGDVVICTDKAKEQAEEFGHSFEREILYLFVHSILHLLGYDHMEEAEKTVMRSREEIVMKQIGLAREAGDDEDKEEDV